MRGKQKSSTNEKADEIRYMCGKERDVTGGEERVEGNYTTCRWQRILDD